MELKWPSVCVKKPLNHSLIVDASSYQTSRDLSSNDTRPTMSTPQLLMHSSRCAPCEQPFTENKINVLERLQTSRARTSEEMLIFHCN